jgi:hypothetical protein
MIGSRSSLATPSTRGYRHGRSHRHRTEASPEDPARARGSSARHEGPERKSARPGRPHAPLHRVRAPQGELVLPRRRRQRRSHPGGHDRPLQGSTGLPTRQGDVVPQLRRATSRSATRLPGRSRTATARSATPSRGRASTTRRSASSRPRSCRASSSRSARACRRSSRRH